MKVNRKDYLKCEKKISRGTLLSMCLFGSIPILGWIFILYVFICQPQKNNSSWKLPNHKNKNDTEVDKLLDKLENDEIGENIDEMFLNMIIDLNERVKELEE